MNTQIVAGIVILFIISLMVRIIPAIMPFNFSNETQNRLKNILPVAVFINLLIYCVYSEIAQHPLATIIASIIALICFRFFGLLLSCILSTVMYLYLTRSDFLNALF